MKRREIQKIVLSFRTNNFKSYKELRILRMEDSDKDSEDLVEDPERLWQKYVIRRKKSE